VKLLFSGYITDEFEDETSGSTLGNMNHYWLFVHYKSKKKLNECPRKLVVMKHFIK